MRRFGPSPMLFVATLAAVGLVGWYFASSREHVELLLFGILVFLGTATGWRWYRVDAEGIHRRDVGGSLLVPWEDVNAVVGRRAGRGDRPTTVLTQFVVDARGRTLLRLDPWIFHRRQMVRLIQATVSARRK